MRGRPPVTRARVLHYWAKHGPCSIMQIVRATGAERSHVKRMLFRISPDYERIDNMEFTPQETERFWSLLSKEPNQGPNGDCWEWIGAITPHGYGRVSIKGKNFQATHVALALDGRPRPGDLSALHSCDNRKCVNPNHLRWGTQQENMQDHVERFARGLHWLPDEVVHEIHQSRETNTEIAKRLGVTPAAICNIRKGRSHKHIFEQYCPIP